jgi:hypothetical protein
MSVIDRSVTQFANGTMPSLRTAMVQGTKAVFRNPVTCFRGVDNRAVYAVYGSTYVTKNASEITCKEKGWDPKWPMFFSTTIINGAIGMWKDKYLAQLFGTQVASFPLSSYMMFAARDCVLIGVSFIGAPMVVPIVQEATGLPHLTADIITQVSVPAFAQLLATPIHLTGLDFYNRPDVTFGQRIADNIKASRGPILVRMFRQGYVFGLGSLSVKYLTKAIIGTEEAVATHSIPVANFK